jgi:hypothetical protein
VLVLRFRSVGLMAFTIVAADIVQCFERPSRYSMIFGIVWLRIDKYLFLAASAPIVSSIVAVRNDWELHSEALLPSTTQNARSRCERAAKPKNSAEKTNQFPFPLLWPLNATRIKREGSEGAAFP